MMIHLAETTLGMSVLQKNITSTDVFDLQELPVMHSSCYLINEEVRKRRVNKQL